MLHRRGSSARVLPVALAVLLGSCSLFDIAGADKGLSQAEVDALTNQVMQGSRNGVQATTVALRASSLRAAIAPVDEPPRTVSCGTSGCVFNESINSTTSCVDGGTIKVLGSLTGSLNNSGSGVLQIGATETITDWKCVGGRVMNGDPYLSMTGTFSFLNGQQSTAANLTISGGFTYGGGSCQILLSFLFNANGTAHATGHVCGRAVDETI